MDREVGSGDVEQRIYAWWLQPGSDAQKGEDSEYGADWVGGEQWQFPGTELSLHGPAAELEVGGPQVGMWAYPSRHGCCVSDFKAPISGLCSPREEAERAESVPPCRPGT